MAYYQNNGGGGYGGYGDGGGYGGGYNNGGGYNAGGGYVNNANQGGFTSPGNNRNNAYTTMMNSQSSGVKSKKSKVCVPMTVKQVKNFCTFQDDVITCDGREISDAVLVVRIVDVQELSSSIEYTIEDGTGKMKTKYWANREDDSTTQMEINNISSWQAHTYVRMAGSLKVYNGNIQFTASQIARVKDHNALTHHYLECIYSHLKATKGALSALGASSTAAAQSTKPLGNKTNAYSTYGQQNQYGAKSISLQQQGTNENSKQGNMAGFDAKSEILALVTEFGQGDNGVHWQQVAQKLTQKNGINEEVTRRLFEDLTDRKSVV